MERRKKIKIIEILLLIVVIITVFTIGDTYSKYKEQSGVNYNVSMKKWFLKVNGKDIYQENTLTTILEPEFVASEYVNDNILVPGRELCFGLDIDYSQVNIKFKVTFNIEQISETQLSDFKVYKYIGPEGEVAVDGSSTIVISIDPEADLTTTSTSLDVYMKWNDDSNNTMDNKADTQFRGETVSGSDNTKLRYKIIATFEQDI